MLEFFKDLNKKHVSIIVIVFLLFSISLYFFYKKEIHAYLNISKDYVTNSEFINEEETNQNDKKVADFYYFYTKWCPHCKSATPIIDEFKTNIQEKNNKFNNVYINFIYVDCEKDKKIADKFSIQGYPTIKLVYNSKVFEYDAKPDLNTLNEFFNSVLV
jgi:thiol-disulfide isomerase/thioredoxin